MLVTMVAKVGGKTVSDSAFYTWELIDTMFSKGECGVATFRDDFAKVITTCIDWDPLWELAGPKAVLLWPAVAVGLLANWLASEFESLYDSFKGYDDYEVWVMREEQSACISEDEFAQLFIEQYSLYDAVNSPDVVIDGEVVCDSEWTAARVWTTYPDAFDMGESTPTLMHWEGDHWELTHNGDGQSNAAVNTDCQSISPDSPVYELMECAIRLSE